MKSNFGLKEQMIGNLMLYCWFLYIKKIRMHGLLFYCVTLNASCSNSLSRRHPSYTFYLSLPLPKYYLYIIYIVATENSIAYVCTRISTNLAAIRVTISFIYIYMHICMCVCYTDPRISHCHGELHHTRNKHSITFHFKLVQFSA